MKEGNKVMIAGLGSVGYSVMEMLSRNPTLSEWVKIIGADVNRENGQRKVNLAVATADKLGLHPDIEFVNMDLLDVDSTAETLRKYDPNLIFQVATLQSWWVREYLPDDERRKLGEAEMGPWLPMHITLPYNLMQAVNKAGINPYVVNASVPDVVCPTLGRLGLAPTVGIGNLGEVTPFIKMVVSKRLGVPIRDVTLYIVGSHYVCYHVESEGSTGGAPYYLRIFVNGKDVTQKIDPDQKLKREGWDDIPQIPADPVMLNILTAATVVKVIRAILQNTREIVNTPGPNGLPGAYPVRLGRELVEVVLPDDITLEEAIKINEEGNRFDGIEKIEDDGTIVITDKSYEVMRRLLGHDVKRFNVRDSHRVAGELGRAFRSYGERVGLPDRALNAIYVRQ
ncbi:MAG: hypothetical protein JSU76_02875 [Dehalococcoidia bacterium]|nr:MAG: hypothetical protein JSU76_02875 [Dehalococcoidia bacterium]